MVTKLCINKQVKVGRKVKLNKLNKQVKGGSKVKLNKLVKGGRKVKYKQTS